MQIRDTGSAYGIVSRMNHAAGAALVLALLGMGLYFHDMPRGEQRGFWLGLHIGLGALAVLPLAFRLCWRAVMRWPQPRVQQPWLARSSRVTHVLLLVLIAVMMLSGPLTVWSIGRPIEVFGWFAVPGPMGEQHALHELLELVHATASRALLVLAVLHMSAAIMHWWAARTPGVAQLRS